jgi:hypothetical protein
MYIYTCSIGAIQIDINRGGRERESVKKKIDLR